MNEVPQSGWMVGAWLAPTSPYLSPPTPVATEACVADCEGGNCCARLRLRNGAWIYEPAAWWGLAGLPPQLGHK